MKKLLISLAAALALTGCATNQDYVVYGQIQAAYAAAEAARFKAIGDIARSGDATAKVAAVMSLQGVGGNSRPQVVAPRSASDTALQWASLVLPSVTQLYGINQNTRVSIRQSDNMAAVAQSTNATFLGISGKIQAPQPNMILSGTGVLGSGSYSIGANSGNSSGNSGKLAGNNIQDATSEPTVVDPVIVTNTETTTNTNTVLQP